MNSVAEACTFPPQPKMDRAKMHKSRARRFIRIPGVKGRTGNETVFFGRESSRGLRACREGDVEHAYTPTHNCSIISRGSDSRACRIAFDTYARVLSGAARVTAVCSGADEKLAAEWYRRGVPLDCIQRASRMGRTRKYVALFHHEAHGPITSLHYFTAIVEEVSAMERPLNYWRYLDSRVHKNGLPNACSSKFCARESTG